MEEIIMRNNIEQQKLISIKQVKSGQVNNVIYFLILLLILLNIQAILTLQHIVRIDIY